jgi:hypothetical protein
MSIIAVGASVLTTDALRFQTVVMSLDLLGGGSFSA